MTNSQLNRRAFLAASSGIVVATALPSISEAASSDRFVPVVNGSLFYDLTGSGTAAILVPAYGFDMRCWAAQVSALSPVRTVIRYDPRGFGKSSRLTEGQAYSHQEDLLRLMDALQIEHADIVGISNGGRIAIGFALAHPDRTRTLIAADASCDGSWPPPDLAWFFAEAHRTALKRGVDAAKEQLITTMPAFLPAMQVPTIATKIRAMTRDFSGWQFLHGDPEKPTVPDASGRLSELRMPVLAITGQRDTSYNRGVIELLARSAPYARKIDIPDVGHFTAMEAPNAFNAAMIEFLSVNPA